MGATAVVIPAWRKKPVEDKMYFKIVPWIPLCSFIIMVSFIELFDGCKHKITAPEDNPTDTNVSAALDSVITVTFQNAQSIKNSIAVSKTIEPAVNEIFNQAIDLYECSAHAEYQININIGKTLPNSIDCTALVDIPPALGISPDSKLFAFAKVELGGDGEELDEFTPIESEIDVPTQKLKVRIPAGAFTQENTIDGSYAAIIKLAVVPIPQIPLNKQTIDVSFGKPLFGPLTITSPMSFIRILYDYGKIAEKTKSHKGVDFIAALNTPVRALSDGTVDIVHDKETSDAGWYVIIKHGLVAKSRYLHLNKINVSQGQPVRKGQVIGLSGNTGKQSPHLHVEYYLLDDKEDPDFISCQSIIPKLVAIDVEPSNITIEKGKIANIKAVPKDEDGGVVEVSKFKDGWQWGWKWTTTDESIIKKDVIEKLGEHPSANITGQEAGTAHMKLELYMTSVVPRFPNTNDNDELKNVLEKVLDKNIDITVTPPPTGVTSIAISPQFLSIEKNITQTLTATAKDKNGDIISLPATNMSWTSSEPTVCSVIGNGVGATVKGISEGTATISAQENESGMTASASVTVTDPDSRVTRIELNPKPSTLYPGDTITVYATAYNQQNRVVQVAANLWHWETSGKSLTIAPNGNRGLVTADSTGSAKITVYTTKFPNIAGEINISVSQEIWPLRVGNQWTWHRTDPIYPQNSHDYQIKIIAGGSNHYSAVWRYNASGSWTDWQSGWSFQRRPNGVWMQGLGVGLFQYPAIVGDTTSKYDQYASPCGSSYIITIVISAGGESHYKMELPVCYPAKKVFANQIREFYLTPGIGMTRHEYSWQDSIGAPLITHDIWNLTEFKHQ